MAVLACRGCLATDVKLYDMHKYSLKSTYEALTGYQLCDEQYPEFMCSLCSTMMLKVVSFSEKCCKSQELLQLMALEYLTITTDHIKSIDREAHLLTPGLISQSAYIDSLELDIKTEDFDQNYQSDSDEEPLSQIKKREHETTEKDLQLPVSIEPVKLEYGDERCDGAIAEVVVLNKSEQLEELQTRKESMNYKNSFYKCDKCYKGFMTNSTFKNHMRRHDPVSGPEICDICFTRWQDTRSLRSHQLVTHEKKFICKICGHVSKSNHSAKEHYLWHSGRTYACSVCGASFTRSTSYLTHVRLRHPSKHSCSLCGDSFLGETGLNMHRKRAHKHAKFTETQDEFICATCNVSFKTKEALETHTSNGEDGVCDTTLRPCAECGAGFGSEELLTSHLADHENSKLVKTCQLCGRVFASERALGAHHARAHAGRRAAAPRAAVCELCGQRCLSKASLVYHQRTHTGEKPYQCSECPKKFSVHQRLQIHIRTHTGESPYKCPVCPKAFKHKAALNRHNRVHTGAKPYTCSHCGKSFSQSNSMKMHVRSVHLRLPALYRQRKPP